MQSDNLWRDRNKVFVAGLPRDVDDDALYNKFRAFGDMFQAKVVFDAATGRSKGFGFLTYRQYDHAMDAIDKTNGRVRTHSRKNSQLTLTLLRIGMEESLMSDF